MALRKSVEVADSTARKLAAIKALETKGISDKYAASGFIVSITPITEGSEFCEPFVLPGEAIGDIGKLIAANLRESLRFRRTLLQEELRSIDAILS